jgi:hypothetical protein
LADDDRSNTAKTRGIRENRKDLKIHERKHGIKNSITKATTSTPAKVVPLKRPGKARPDKGYVPPARPYGELRQARNEAKKHAK